MKKSSYEVVEILIKDVDRTLRSVDVIGSEVVDILGVLQPPCQEPVLALLVNCEQGSDRKIRVFIKVVDSTESVGDSTTAASGYQAGPPKYAGSFNAGGLLSVFLKHVFVTNWQPLVD